MAPTKLHRRVRIGLPELHGRIPIGLPELHRRFLLTHLNGSYGSVLSHLRFPTQSGLTRFPQSGISLVPCRGGGQRALFDLSFLHATTQTQAYIRGVWLFHIFLGQKFDPTLVKSFFKNAMENPFFDLFKYGPKHSKKKIKIEIWTFLFQICFQNQFSTLGSGQTENTKIRVFVYFQFDHFPKFKNDSESRFEMRMPIFLF